MAETNRLDEMREVLQRLIDSPVEFDEHRNYVVMQIQRDDLEIAQLLLSPEDHSEGQCTNENEGILSMKNQGEEDKEPWTRIY